MKQDKLETYIYSSTLLNKTINKMNLLGYKYKKDPIKFLNIRLFTSVIIFFIVLLIFDMGYIYAPIITLVYYNIYFYLFLDIKIKKRAEKLDYEALYFFEVLTLALEAKRNLETAISLTVENINSEISMEFRKTLYEVKFGKSLDEALKDTKKRIPSETINNIILNIMESNIFGNSIVETLYNQIDFLGEKRMFTIKERIAKIPAKVSIISVIFFLPLMLLLIIGPLIITQLGL